MTYGMRPPGMWFPEKEAWNKIGRLFLPTLQRPSPSS